MANTKQVFTKLNASIVNALKNAPEGMTGAELTEAIGEPVLPGHLVGAMKKGLIEVIGAREVTKVKPAGAATLYELVSAEPLKGEDGKEFNYTDSAKEILAAAAALGRNFTLADLSEAMGKKIVSGHTNHLVKKGNLRNLGKIGLGRETTVTDEVNVYGFVKDIPADAEIR